MRLRANSDFSGGKLASNDHAHPKTPISQNMVTNMFTSRCVFDPLIEKHLKAAIFGRVGQFVDIQK
ncbi:hypothetical protein DCO57_14595 [Labrenzia sp. 011]|nr:hypothetical protein DCO57_14595 [Labrenzia sp. 011]